MTTQYCLIENNEISEGPKNLPKSWRNISGLHLASLERLKELGWLPVTENQNGFNGSLHAHTGWVYTIAENSVIATRQYTSLPAIRIISPRQLRERLTNEEQAAINIMSLTDAQVFDWRMRAAEAQEIDLSHAETLLGLQFLVYKGLLNEARISEILA